MMSEEKKVNEMTETEIKANLYDQVMLLNITKQNIKLLETELKQRINREKKTDSEEPEPDKT